MTFEDTLKELGDWGMAHLAEFLIAGMLLLAGLLVGWLLQMIARTLLVSLGLDGFAERSGLAVFLFFLASALETVGMPRVADYMAQIGAFMPRILAALLLVIVGIFGGRLCREFFTEERHRRGDPQTWQRVAQSAQVLIVVAAVLLALSVLGLNLMPILWLLGALIMAAGLVLAIAWGSVLRQRSDSWLVARWLRQQVEIGDQVKIGEMEGTVASIGDARLTLRTADGLVHVPNAAVSDQALTILTVEPEAESSSFDMS